MKTRTNQSFLISIFFLIVSSWIYPIGSFFNTKETTTKDPIEKRYNKEQIKNRQRIAHWIKHGVTFLALENISIGADVEIGAGTSIANGVHILSGSRIGKNCNIQNSCIIDNTTLEDNVTIHPLCVVRNSHISKQSQIGPFAHVHSGTKIGSKTTIGNFVEVKKSQLGEKTKAKHLSYLGDATIGSQVNIGAGTITCNYNGFTKHQTTIEDNAFIGSNNTIIAPVTIEKSAFTAAGSTITKDVPSCSLAIGRARQINKDNYTKKLVEKCSPRPNTDNKD